MSDVGKVYLLGAGPGDPELVTVRALRRLAEANLVLYDALVHPDLLTRVKPGAEVAFVGKRAGRASERQGAINARLLEAARAGKVVARLKGGDPYLFGRGSEEAEVLAAAGIPFEVVPGVPSPVAATAYAGISLTHRSLSSSVAYITATESSAKDRTSHDWARLATGPETLVIFMGLRKLAGLMALLIEHGRPAGTPAAVVQNASLPTQRVVVGTVGDIADRVAEAGLGTPAITIVGEVVALRASLRWFDRAPLFGKRVLVTRPVGQANDLAARLRDEGAVPVVAPTIRIVPPEDPAPLAEAAAAVHTYDWIVFTSANGVDAFFAALDHLGRDARALPARVCAIGPKTAHALEARGIRADTIPDEYRGEAVVDAILDEARTLKGARILLPRAAIARDVVPERLRAAGARVDVVPAYRSVRPGPEESARIGALFDEDAVDVVTFTSSSTVKNLVEVLGDEAPARLAARTVASIGPITSETAAELGIRVDVTASEYTIEGLVRALSDHFRR